MVMGKYLLKILLELMLRTGIQSASAIHVPITFKNIIMLNFKFKYMMFSLSNNLIPCCSIHPQSIDFIVVAPIKRKRVGKGNPSGVERKYIVISQRIIPPQLLWNPYPLQLKKIGLHG
jgi:hypothetical protein